MRWEPTLALLEANVLPRWSLVRRDHRPIAHPPQILPRTNLYLFFDCMRVIEAMQVCLAVSSGHWRDFPLEAAAIKVSTLAPSAASERSRLLTQIAD